MSSVGRDGRNYGIGSNNNRSEVPGPTAYTNRLGKAISLVNKQKVFCTDIHGDPHWVDRKSAIRWINSNQRYYFIEKPLPLDTKPEEVKRIYERPVLFDAVKSRLMDEKDFLRRIATDYKDMALAIPVVGYETLIAALSPPPCIDDTKGEMRDNYCVVNFVRESRLETDVAAAHQLLEKNKIVAETQENSLEDFAILEPVKSDVELKPEMQQEIERKFAMQQEISDSEANPALAGEFSLHSSVLKTRVGPYETHLDGAVGVASHIGERARQEDSHIVCDFEVAGHKIRLTGVFDGHGNSAAMSRFISEQLPAQLTFRLEKFLGVYPRELAIYNALKIVPFDLAMRFFEKDPKSNSGSTATFQLQIDDRLWTHNLGDSRTLHLSIDESGQAIVTQKSEDMGMTEKYTKGVIKRGGEVHDGIMTGMLSIPRAIGDKPISAPASARGKSIVEENPRKGYTIHVCDGVTDVMTNLEIGQFISDRLKKGDSLAAAAKSIVEFAFARGSQDNLSCMIVDLSK